MRRIAELQQSIRKTCERNPLQNTLNKSTATSVYNSALDPGSSLADVDMASTANVQPQAQASLVARTPTLDQPGRLSGSGATSHKRNIDNGSNSDNLAVLLQAKADLAEALSRCEDRLASMEGELLSCCPNVLTSSPREVRPVWKRKPPTNVRQQHGQPCGRQDGRARKIRQQQWCNRSLHAVLLVVCFLMLNPPRIACLYTAVIRTRTRTHSTIMNMFLSPLLCSNL